MSIIILGHESFARLQSRFLHLATRTLLLTAFAQVALAAIAAPRRAPEVRELQVTVTEVRRLKPNQVEIHVTLENKTDGDLYLPTYGAAEWLEIHTLRVLHWQTGRGWLPLGPFSELPPDTAMRLGPGQTYTLRRLLQDPGMTPSPGEGIPMRKAESIPLRGKHKIRVGYYCGQTEWQAYRDYVESISHRAARRNKPGSPPQMKFAESGEFNIPTEKL